MYKALHDKVEYPRWAKDFAPRFKRLDGLDRLLDGTIYNHLGNAFYDETDGSGKIIPIVERRPSAQYRLLRMVARWSARKLFSGRHVPLIRSKDAAVAKQARRVVKSARFWARLAEAVYLGSVGSVGVTFRLDSKGRPSITCWRAKFCWPTLDEHNELVSLRICYVVRGATIKAMDPSLSSLLDQSDYWFIRDYTSTEEVTFVPPKKEEWDPAEGFADKTQTLVPIKALTFAHKFGFVPGHWFINLPGGAGCDGVCTWEDAIPNAIELDYTLSQIGRGVRYNCAPQLVTVGQVLGGADEITRAPVTHIQMAASHKTEDGETLGQGDAKLLEMSGAGTEAALKLIDKLRNLALESISASRKDPEKIKGNMSGRAMEFMDEDTDDLVMELRSQYGEHGCLPLLRKIMAAKTIKGGEKLDLQWPRIFQPTPDDLAKLIPALVQACGGAAKPAPGEPGTTPQAAPVVLLDVDKAKKYLEANMDLSMYEDADDDIDDPDEGEPDNAGGPAPEATGEGLTEQVGGLTIHAPVQVHD